ncbi:MAG: response regulator, partial [Catenulispora sp.]
DYERVQTAAAAADALRLRPPDLVISDYAMPGFGAEEALALLRDSGLDVPFILVSGRVGEESAVALMRAGAHDFVLKEDLARLAPAVRRELMHARSRAQRRELEQQLRQTERLDSLGRLAGGIAHDFNNLLAVVLGRADLMLAELPEDHRLRGDLGIVREVAERGAALTRRILVFSRQEPLRPEKLDVNQVVTVTKEALGGAVGEDVEFVSDLGPGPLPVEIDRSELERLLLNLVVNSRKAMPHGGRLTITTDTVRGPAAGAGPMVRVCVTDTGVGMSASVLERAFEPYYTTDTAAGTGLGLSSAYGVVTAAAGEISLRSQLGVGTTVEIVLPMVDHADLAAPGAQAEPAPGGGRSVLVVEDDEDVRDLVVLMLSRSGYQVTEAPSPDKALVLLDVAKSEVDLLLSDIVMPGMSGIELAESVRAIRPGTPVLLMSGYTAGTLPDDASLPPGVSLIRKPFTRAALLGAVEQALAGSQ